MAENKDKYLGSAKFSRPESEEQLEIEKQIQWQQLQRDLWLISGQPGLSEKENSSVESMLEAVREKIK